MAKQQLKNDSQSQLFPAKLQEQEPAPARERGSSGWSGAARPSSDRAVSTAAGPARTGPAGRAPARRARDARPRR